MTHLLSNLELMMNGLSPERDTQNYDRSDWSQREMTVFSDGLTRREVFRFGVCSTLSLCIASPYAAEPNDLRALYRVREGDLTAAVLGMPVLIESVESAGEVRGTVHAISGRSFADVALALRQPVVWCEMLALHLNTKSCSMGVEAEKSLLTVSIARKHDQSVSQAYPLRLHWQITEAQSNYLEVRLTGASGPFGTTDYLILLKATEVSGHRTFMELSYSCRFGAPASIAMRGYFATIGSGKVGFSKADNRGDQRLVGGLRGVVERTAMRYYLAIEAWLEASRVAPADQLKRRLENWFDSTERFPRQLREMDRASYLAMKLRDFGAAPLRKAPQ